MAPSVDTCDASSTNLGFDMGSVELQQLSPSPELVACPSVALLRDSLRHSAVDALRQNFLISMMAGHWFNVLPSTKTQQSSSSASANFSNAAGGGNHSGGSSADASGGSAQKDSKKSPAPPNMNNALCKPLWRFCKLSSTQKTFLLSPEVQDIPTGVLAETGPPTEDLVTKIDFANVKDFRVTSLPPHIGQQLGLKITSSTIFGSQIVPGSSSSSPTNLVGSASGGNSPPTPTSGMLNSAAGPNIGVHNNISSLGLGIRPGTELPALATLAFIDQDDSVIAEFVCTSAKVLCEWSDGLRLLKGRTLGTAETEALVESLVSTLLQVRLLDVPVPKLQHNSSLFGGTVPPAPRNLDFYYLDLAAGSGDQQNVGDTANAEAGPI